MLSFSILPLCKKQVQSIIEYLNCLERDWNWARLKWQFVKKQQLFILVRVLFGHCRGMYNVLFMFVFRFEWSYFCLAISWSDKDLLWWCLMNLFMFNRRSQFSWEYQANLSQKWSCNFFSASDYERLLFCFSQIFFQILFKPLISFPYCSVKIPHNEWFKSLI